MGCVRSGAICERIVFSPKGHGVLHQPMGDTMIWETRGTVRRPLGNIGIIMAEPDATPHYCFVMDKLDGGVRVSNPNGFKVPSKFVLRYAGREAKYEVIWRNGRQISATPISKRRKAG